MNADAQIEERLSPAGQVVLAAKRGDFAFLIGALTAIDRHARWLAARELGAAKVNDAVEPLMRCALNASDQTFRANCITALGKIGDTRAIPALWQVAHGSEPFGVRSLAMVSLVQLGERQAIAMLAHIVTDPDLLTTYSDAGGLPPISERPARRWAAKRLVELQALEAIPLLQEAASSLAWRDRWRLQRLSRAIRRRL